MDPYKNANVGEETSSKLVVRSDNSLHKLQLCCPLVLL
jgi:hypothetical protein